VIGPVYTVPEEGEGLSLFIVYLIEAFGSSGEEITTEIGLV